MSLSISQIGYLIFSILPLSYLLIKVGGIFFGTKKIPSNTQAICTEISGIITKEYLKPKSILFENFKTTIKKNGEITIKNIHTKEKKSHPQRALKDFNAIKKISDITSICHYPGASRIETAVLQFLKQCHLHEEIIKKKYDLIDEIDCNSIKKISTVIARHKKSKEITAFTKGHAEKVLARCTRMYINGQKVDISSQVRRRIQKYIQRLNQKGEKSIAFAYKPLPQKKLDKYSAKLSESEMVLIGVVGLSNPINENVIESIRIAKKADIKIFTITSINKKKAETIIKSVRMIKKHQLKNISGRELKNMKLKKLKNLIRKKHQNFLFSEISSTQNQKLIGIIKEAYPNCIIATPKKNIEFIIKEIEKSRIYDENIQKILIHSIPCKIAQMVLLVLSIPLKIPFPFTIGLLIAMDLIINAPLELGLKLEKPDLKIMDHSYKPKKGLLKEKNTLKHILLNGLVVSLILSTVYFWNLMRQGWTFGQSIQVDKAFFTKSITIIFILLAIIQIFYAYNHRQIHKSIFRINPLSNIFIVLLIIISFLVIYIFTNFNFFQSRFDLINLSPLEWQIILLSAAITIIIEEIRIILSKIHEH